jgi:predicted HicB family RNase H-like nuclease
MNTLTYKAYTARMEFDKRDNILIGKLLGISDIIAFHADNVTELRSAFEKAVEDYLECCEKSANHPKNLLAAKCCCVFHPKFTHKH